MKTVNDNICSIEVEEEPGAPLILVLEESGTHFGGRLYNDLTPAFRVRSFSHTYNMFERIQRAAHRGEEVKSIIVYKSLCPLAFIDAWGFISSLPEMEQVMLYYYHDNVLYGFRGGRKEFAYPLYKVNDVEFQLGIILETLTLSRERAA